MLGMSGDLGRVALRPYRVLPASTGINLTFYPDFIHNIDQYFANTSPFVLNSGYLTLIESFCMYADGADDVKHAACAALDEYLATLTLTGDITNA